MSIRYRPSVSTSSIRRSVVYGSNQSESVRRRDWQPAAEDRRWTEKEIQADLYKTRTCVVCGEQFVEATNIAQLKCRQHPEPVRWVNRDRLVGRWQCCGREYEPSDKGCRRCDHTSEDLPLDSRVHYEPLSFFFAEDSKTGQYTSKIPMPASGADLGVITRYREDAPDKLDLERCVVRFVRIGAQCIAKDAPEQSQDASHSQTQNSRTTRR
jgi:hypothetical protein